MVHDKLSQNAPEKCRPKVKLSIHEHTTTKQLCLQKTHVEHSSQMRTKAEVEAITSPTGDCKVEA
eukprot:304235-Pelagomonas_calceolata.AAC.3